MKLLMAFLLGMVVIGLMTDRFDKRTYGIVIGATLFTTTLFFGFQRFML